MSTRKRTLRSNSKQSQEPAEWSVEEQVPVHVVRSPSSPSASVVEPEPSTDKPTSSAPPAPSVRAVEDGIEYVHTCCVTVTTQLRLQQKKEQTRKRRAQARAVLLVHSHSPTQRATKQTTLTAFAFQAPKSRPALSTATANQLQGRDHQAAPQAKMKKAVKVEPVVEGYGDAETVSEDDVKVVDVLPPKPLRQWHTIDLEENEPQVVQQGAPGVALHVPHKEHDYCMNKEANDVH